MYSLNSKDNLLLKIDCEGCEYNLLDESIEVLRKFNRIEIEFHYGYKKLESKLKEAGFIVYHSKPYKSDKNDLYLKKLALANRDYTIGLIYAKRRLI
jgi:SpoVK/Ycf46/Vps4 family AAA+-type ATPase